MVLDVRSIHVFTGAVLGLLIAGGGLAAREQTQAAGARTLTVDVWVRDAQGQPVASLAPGDFTVQLDGQQRRVTAARFENYASDAPSPAGAAAPASLPGRTIAIVVDDLSFERDEATPLGGVAARWVAQLHLADRVAVVRATTTGVVAGDRSDAASRVRTATGAREASPVSGSEAEFLRDRQTLDQAEALASAISWLAGQPGPRVLVVLSKGMPMPLAAAQYLASSFRIARDAGISAFLIAPDAASTSSPTPVPGVTESSNSAAAGLDQIAAGLGGRVVRAQGAGDAAMAEVQRAVSGVYRVDVDVPSAGPLPRTMPTSVSVRSAGLVVRTGALVLPPPGMSAPRTTADRTRDILAGVDTAGEIDFDAVTSLSRDTSSADQLQLTVSLVLPRDMPSPVRVAFGLLDATGTLRSGTIDVPDAERGPRRSAVAIAVAPGWHRLTLVAQDGNERLGSRAQAVHARLRSIGGYAAADPRVLWRADTETWNMPGGEALPDAAVVAASVFELYPDVPGGEAPPPLPLRLEDQSGLEVATRMITPTPVGQGWRLSSEVRLDGLAPGEYVFRLDTALIDAGAGPLTLRFRKGTTAAAPAASAAPRPAPTPLPNPADLVNLFRAGVRDNWPRFAPEDLLVSDLLIPQLKTLAGSRPLPAALVNATGNAWWAALRATAAQRTVVGLAARGLTALHDGDPRAAQSHLRDAMAGSPSSMAARRLLGIAYAAAGRDDGAAGIWSGAIEARTDDPRWSVAFAEALGRVGDYKAALETLRAMPGEPSGRRADRLVEALLVVGLTDEALAALVAWETGEGRERPAARLTFYLVALRYAAALQPAADARAIDDFRRLADRYVAAGGEYADLVAPWIQSAASLGAR
jgi:VWFA-related protein